MLHTKYMNTLPASTAMDVMQLLTRPEPHSVNVGPKYIKTITILIPWTFGWTNPIICTLAWNRNTANYPAANYLPKKEATQSPPKTETAVGTATAPTMPRFVVGKMGSNCYMYDPNKNHLKINLYR